MAREAIDEETREHFQLQISKIFDQVQTSTSNHRKNHVALYKLHTELAAIKKSIKNGTQESLIGETLFKKIFHDLLTRTLPHKKGVACADRVIKFVGSYVRFINERAAEERDAQKDEDEDDEDDDEEEEETYVSRFTAKLLDFLVEGIASKDKNVRYRVLQTIAEMISYLGSIDPDTYEMLKTGILERIYDKEANIRVQAAISLAKLSDSDERDPETGFSSIDNSLIQILAHDSSPDVRRYTLLNMPINRQTLPAALLRMRDRDTLIRKSVYSLVLEDRVKPQADSKWQDQVSFLHPRCLSIAQREQVIRNGLHDRESSVKAATESLIVVWLDLMSENPHPNSHDGTAMENTKETTMNEKIIALVSLFDLQGEGIIAEDLLESLLSNPSIFRKVTFDGNYWEEITLEKALFARVFVEHCRKHKKEEALDTMLPVVMELAFYIQSSYNSLVQHIADGVASKLTSLDEDAASVGEFEDKREILEAVLSELLKLALSLDYSDEIGRRKMLVLVREMLSTESLSEPVMLRCLDVLTTIIANEKELIRIVVEEVQDLRDNATIDDGSVAEEIQNPDVSIDESQSTSPSQPPQKSSKELSPEQQARIDAVDLKCLTLLSGMLERVNGKLRENSALEGALKSLIFPSIQRKDVRFRQKGLKCMALYCLIAKDLAVKSFGFFIRHVTSSPVPIKVTIMQSLFDMLMMHDYALFQVSATAYDDFIKFLLDLLQIEEDATLKAVLCEGASKLLLQNIVTPKEILPNLIKNFISPATKDNQALRQCLDLFLRRYSWSSKARQQKMRENFIHIFLDVCQDRHEADDDDDEIVTSARLTELFTFWTDPIQLEGLVTNADVNVDYSIHMDLAHDIIKLLIDTNVKVTLAKEDKRVLCQALNRLYVPDTIDDLKVKGLKVLMGRVRQRSLGDAVSKNAFKKFEAMIDKKFEKELENCSEEDLRALEEFQDLFKFLDDLIPLSDDDEEETSRVKKRRSQSTGSLGVEGGSDEDHGASGPVRPNKRARLSGNDGIGSSKRILPRRAAKTNAKPIQIINLEDYEEGTPDTLESAVSKLSVNESQLDRDISKLLDPLSATTSSTVDSIMDADTEDEEVSELLAES